MIFALPLILLAEAVTACPPSGVARLAGGAIIVHPVATFEQPPFGRLGPTTSIRTKPADIQQTGAEAADEAEPGAGHAAQQCEATVTPTV